MESAIFGYSEYVVWSFTNMWEDSSKIIKKSKEKDKADVLSEDIKKYSMDILYFKKVYFLNER